jgi:hypothetical protein
MPVDKTAAAEALLGDGYRVIPSFLDATDLRLLTQDIEALLSSPRGASMCRPGLIPLRWNDAIVARILQPARPARVLRDALRARRRHAADRRAIKPPRATVAKRTELPTGRLALSALIGGTR